jgi:hypothetical protein
LPQRDDGGSDSDAPRTETGELKGYCGIATKAEQAPLLLFPRSLEARCKPTKPEPDELRKLFRVV